jgi:1,4-dihydroxy-2-naphthoate octaprenyltransferase
MSRPSQLLLIGLVYALGVVIAVAKGASLDAESALWGALALLPVAVSVHYVNEYADYETDQLTRSTPFSGGSGALQHTGLPRNVPLYAAVLALVAGLVGGGFLLGRGISVQAFGLLVLIGVLGWQYSVGPLALVWNGLGEVTNVLLGAICLPLYGAATQTGRAEASVLLACLPFAFAVFVNLLETHWPDRAADDTVGKRTLATLWSRDGLRIAYVAGALATLVSPVVLVGDALPPLVAYPSLVVAPLYVWGVGRYTHREDPFPAVAAMVVLAVVQIGTWGMIAGVWEYTPYFVKFYIIFPFVLVL